MGSCHSCWHFLHSQFPLITFSALWNNAFGETIGATLAIDIEVEAVSVTRYILNRMPNTNKVSGRNKRGVLVQVWRWPDPINSQAEFDSYERGGYGNIYP